MNDRKKKEELLSRLREKRIRLARSSLWKFCKLLDGSFYTESKPHLKILCDTLQNFYEKKLIDPISLEIFYSLMINLPPRHGKSRTLINFCAWILGQSIENKILTVSSGDDLATDFSRYTRDLIQKEKLKQSEIVYSDVFPNTRIKKGNASYEKWAVDGYFFNYLGAGYHSNKITGKGFTVIIVDDVISGIEVALNETELNKIWQFVSGTLEQRKEKGTLEIFNMTRWHKKDPCGRFLSNPDLAKDFFQLRMEIMDKDGNMLCDEIMDKKDFEKRKKRTNKLVFKANFYQEPIDIEGQLYQFDRFYTNELKIKNETIACLDLADKGTDFLSMPIADRVGIELYIKDWLYTDERLRLTESQVVEHLIRNKVDRIRIETNFGGESFIISLERLLREKKYHCIIESHFETSNKLTRILANSSIVEQNTIFPNTFGTTHEKVWNDLNDFNKNGKNAHDDSADSLTGLHEMISGYDPFGGL